MQTTLTEIAKENPRRVGLAIKNCTGIGNPTGAYMAISEDKGDARTARGFLMWPGDVVVLLKSEGDHPEKSWYGQSAAGTSCCVTIESMEEG